MEQLANILPKLTGVGFFPLLALFPYKLAESTVKAEPKHALTVFCVFVGFVTLLAGLAFFLQLNRPEPISPLPEKLETPIS